MSVAIRKLIANLHYQAIKGDCPPGVPEALEILLERVRALELHLANHPGQPMRLIKPHGTVGGTGE